MKKLDVRFDTGLLDERFAYFVRETLFSKSEIARAAMNIGLTQLFLAKSATLLIDENKGRVIESAIVSKEVVK